MKKECCKKEDNWIHDIEQDEGENYAFEIWSCLYCGEEISKELVNDSLTSGYGEDNE